jgi:uncharacterized repeat protein (TIGR01451 family)
MRRSLAVFSVLAVALVLGFTLASAQEVPTPQASLRQTVGPFYFTAAQNSLQPTAAQDAPCNPQVTPATGAPGTSVAQTYRAAPLANGSYWTNAPINIALRFGAPETGPVASTGFSVNATVRFGSVRVGTGSAQVGQLTAEQTVNVQIPAPAPDALPVAPAGANFEVEVRVTATPGPHNFALRCSEQSVVSAFEVVRGEPGEGDLDGDGVPDSEDDDRDGDGIPNADEASLTCQVLGEEVSFADENRLQPTPNDADADGHTDEQECAAGSDPFDALSIPPQPEPFPWGLLIGLLILLILLAAIIFFFTVYGKAVALTVISAGELIIPPGQTGKFHLQVQNTRKKGSPINFQLSAAGMPEGWDARLQPDHALLDPQGGAHNLEDVWLTVEAPTHTDPESAVVKVKAVALNAAGRKDTLKLPGTVKTITSINVPPNAKVPVKRGGPVKLRDEKGAAAEAPAAPAEAPMAALEADRPAIDIEGIGETYAKKLEKMGINTIHALRQANAAEVAKKTGAPETTVREWMAMAELIDVKGVGKQYAELLVRAGVTSIAQLAASDAKELAGRIEEVQEGREVRIQGGPAGVKTVKGWIKAAKDHPLGKAGPAPAAAAPAPAAPAAPAAPPGGKPALQVGGLTHAPAAFAAGQTVKSSVTVTNNGTAPQTLKLNLFVNDQLADAQTVSVKPGKSKDVQFKWTAQQQNKLNIRGELVAG